MTRWFLRFSHSLRQPLSLKNYNMTQDNPLTRLPTRETYISPSCDWPASTHQGSWLFSDKKGPQHHINIGITLSTNQVCWYGQRRVILDHPWRWLTICQIIPVGPIILDIKPLETACINGQSSHQTAKAYIPIKTFSLSNRRCAVSHVLKSYQYVPIAAWPSQKCDQKCGTVHALNVQYDWLSACHVSTLAWIILRLHEKVFY